MSGQEQVLRFITALRQAQAKDGIEIVEELGGSNRGHKLEQLGISSTESQLPRSFSDDISQESTNSDEKLQINVPKLLQPISDPAEVSSHPAIKHIFTNPFLKKMSDELLDRLVDDKDLLSQIVKLMGSFLGDDDASIIPQIMSQMEEQQPYPTPEPGQPLEPVVEDPSWFFKAPEIFIDPDNGLEEEEARLLREKLQVAQQRMEEYVRCLTEVRMGLTRTQRLRRNVLNWCREMNGEDYVQVDLDSQNNADNAGLGDQPAKDIYNGNS